MLGVVVEFAGGVSIFIKEEKVWFVACESQLKKEFLDLLIFLRRKN